MFRLRQLEAVIDQFGLPVDPTDDYDGYEHRPFEHYVEVQLWSDTPSSIFSRYRRADEIERFPRSDV